MQNNFSGEWNNTRFFRFIFPSILMLGFLALYNCVDGFFVARYVGPEALAALNIVHPVTSLLLSFGLMLAVGGSAVITIKLGEGKKDEADRKFTQIAAINSILALMICVIIMIFLEPILHFLGARGELYSPSRDYLFVMLIFGPVFTGKISFEYLSRADGAPRVALYATVLGGVLNIILDYVFIARLGWGVTGAAVATGIGNLAGGIIPLLYFFSGKSVLRFVKTKTDWLFLAQASFNGSSEMVNSLSAGFVTLLYNQQALRMMGTTGVAAISALMFFDWLIVSIQLGATTGYAPLISYAYGSRDSKLFNFFLKRSMAVTVFMTAAAAVTGIVFGPDIISLFDKEGGGLSTVLETAVRIFSLAFLFSAFNIFTSGFFTAIGNGKLSAILSVLRSMAASITGVMILPAVFGVNGLWMVRPFAEVLCFILALTFLLRKLPGVSERTAGGDCSRSMAAAEV